MIPGRRYKITRRCLERRFFLTPDAPKVRHIIGYLLGYCLDKYGLKLHAACFMGNHYHLDVTDVRGNFPKFKSTFNGLLSRHLNAHRGRFDKFWSADRPCDVELVSPADVLNRMSYTIANPVTSYLVPKSGRWPGMTTAGMDFGQSLTFKRPSGFFQDGETKMPESVMVTVERPDILQHLSNEELMAKLLELVKDRERAADEKRREENRRFMLESRILKQKWDRRPKTHEDRFTTTPAIAAGSIWAKLAALQRDRDWEEAYADARDADIPGASPVYPYGTFNRRLYGGVRVAPPN